MSLPASSALYGLLRQLAEHIPAAESGAPAESKPRGRQGKRREAEAESDSAPPPPPFQKSAPPAEAPVARKKTTQMEKPRAPTPPKSIGKKREASGYSLAYGHYRKEGMSHAEAVAAAKKDMSS